MPGEQVVLDYDYTFTTPYAGSQCIENSEVCVVTSHTWLSGEFSAI